MSDFITALGAAFGGIFVGACLIAGSAFSVAVRATRAAEIDAEIITRLRVENDNLHDGLRKAREHAEVLAVTLAYREGGEEWARLVASALTSDAHVPFHEHAEQAIRITRDEDPS
jgi:hypothetical protein